jgi:DNA polymerase-2
MVKTEGFLLTRQWKEHGDGQDLIYWIATRTEPIQVVVKNQFSVFFIAKSDLDRTVRVLSDIKDWHHKSVDLKTFFDKDQAIALYFKNQKDLHFARSRLENAQITSYEADVRPTDRYLMERFVQGAVTIEGETTFGDGLAYYLNPKMSKSDFRPELKVVSLDIETSFTEKVLYSIALYTDAERRVFLVSDTDILSKDCDIECFTNEYALLLRFLEWMEQSDPDVIIGWSVVGFDLNFLQQRCDALGISFALGRKKESVEWRTANQDASRKFALVPGRVVLDGIELLRTATYTFESFSLEFVSRTLLGESKLVQDVDARAVEIQEMYANDRTKLAEYNLQDCKLVWDIFEKTDLLDFAIERSTLTGLDMDRAGGSVAAFDFLYLPRLHREGFVAPVAGESRDGVSPGGFVLESKAGLYEDVVVLDFKSLYPSIIRTFHVDPLALIVSVESDIPGFKEASFSRTRTILPRIIEDLWEARDRAKQEGNAVLSKAIKIIMNSFYGVLGTPACRFFDARLASSITMRGHEILRRTQELIEARGFPVIYGDTDSVFVHLSDAQGSVSLSATELVDSINRWWRYYLDEQYSIPSFLELEYETYFLKFLMPTVRGSEKGSKKRYAGMVSVDGSNQLVFRGLETVRSDWSPLAREFQQELYRRVFLDEPFEEYVKHVVDQVQQGKLDDQLVLRRRMRRKIDDYVKNVPPHVRAARLARNIRQSRGLPTTLETGGWIEYLMTVSGPEPRKYVTSPLDYAFYVERQLSPIADAIFSFKSTSLAEITDLQMSLF